MSAFQAFRNFLSLPKPLRTCNNPESANMYPAPSGLFCHAVRKYSSGRYAPGRLSRAKHMSYVYLRAKSQTTKTPQQNPMMNIPRYLHYTETANRKPETMFLDEKHTVRLLTPQSANVHVDDTLERM